MPKFVFDAKLSSSFSIDAPDKSTAEKWLYEALDCASIQFGTLPNGDPIVGAVCLSGKILYAGNVDGWPDTCDPFH